MNEFLGNELLVFNRPARTVRRHPASGVHGGTGNSIALVIMIISSLAVSAVLVATYGRLLAAFAILSGIVVLCITIYRIDWGFFVLIGCVLTFDQFNVPNMNPVTLKAGYFLNLKEIPYLPSFGAAVMNPLELHLILLLLVWFIVLLTHKERLLAHVPAWGAALVFYLAVLGFFVYGLRSGGKFLTALWEVRALFYLGVMYFFVPQIITTKEQVRAFFGVCTVAISVKACQAIYRFARLGFSTGGLETLTNHEDPLFFLTLIFLMLGLFLFDARTKQRWVLLGLFVPLVIAFYAGERRATYAAIGPMLVVMFTVIPTQQRWLLAKSALPVLFIVAIYAAVFWNSESRIASPLRLVKSGFATDREEAGERYYSNLYRKYEKYDLAVTAQASPLVGIGFGNKYEQPLKLVPIAFPLRDYIPHNEILWVMVKTGAVGFLLFWFFFDSFACNGANTILRLKDPYLKAALMVAVCTVIGQMTISYFDLQLTYYRNMVYLGSLMGLLPAVQAMEKGERNEQGT